VPDSDHKITIQSITSPHHTERVDRAKYMAMRGALLAILPKTPPGFTVDAAKSALLAELSQEHFPGGQKAGWWLKAVQLDLEEKGVIRRTPGKPVRLHKV
jgi:hypothetical protein